MPKKKNTYDKLIKKNPHFEGVIARKSWDYIDWSDDKTGKFLRELWKENTRKNAKLFKQHGSIKDLKGLGENKAVIAVGAGQSFNKNKDVLKKVVDFDGVRDWVVRDFVIIASNHQYKPLLELGIIPDFVMLADGSDVVFDQLCKDVPRNGQNTILLAGTHCSNKTIQEWSKQDRMVKFYVPNTKGIDVVFKKHMKKSPVHHSIWQGGNVLNTAWNAASKFFGSTVFMVVGNDLSYPLQDDVQMQRDTYYADGDYSSNLATKRDEAHKGKRWLGYTLNKKHIYTGDYRKSYNVELDIVGTSPTLWVYKTWIESQILANEKSKIHYYNCSEGGILGVMCKDDSDEGLLEESNWFLLDEKSSRWHTALLEDAVSEFLVAKEMFQCQRAGILTNALSVIDSGRGIIDLAGNVKKSWQTINGMGLCP